MNIFPPDQEPCILAVDDRKANLVALRSVLTGVPARLITASSGNEALAATLRHAFALAILDVQMPGMDGYELAEILQSDPVTAQIPIIFVTAAQIDETHAFRGYRSGAVDYLVKPYHPAVLIAKITVFLKLAAQRIALEQSRRQYATLFQEMRNGFALHEIICDAAGNPVDYRFLEINPAFEELTGLKASRIIDKTVREILPDIESAWLDIYGQVALSGQPATFTRYAKALHKHFEVNAFSPARNQFAVIMADITDRLTAEAERRRAEDELKEKNQALMAATTQARMANAAKSRFLASMSHEIRTPLNAILGFTELLNRDTSLLPLHRQHVKTIARSGAHLLRLINDILDMARVEAGRITIEAADFDVPNLFDYLQSLFEPRLTEKQLGFQLELDADVPRTVRGDEGRIRQILVNLLGNAAKFTQKGGVILRARSQTQPRTGDDAALRLVVEVVDTGPGIDPEQQAHLFTEFYQTAQEHQAGGSGLGLAISRRFAELMGGSLTVSSQVNQGSCFRLEVPLMPVQEPARHATQPRQVIGLAPDTPPPRLLVVDDQPDNRALLQALLEPLGFEVRTATNGLEGLEQHAAWQPHAILLDMRMPIMDGHTMARRIRSDSNAAKPVIIALTAGAYEANRRQALIAGVDDYLPKPVQTGHLLRILEERLAIRYRYTAETDKVVPAAAPLATRLQTEMIEAVRAALQDGDTDQLLILADTLAEVNAPAAQQLQAMVEQYDYEAIEQWLAGD